MPQLVLKKRHRLRRKVIKTVLAQIWETNGLLPPWLEEDMDGAKGPTGMVYILGGDIVAMEVDGKATLALRGLLRHLPPKGFVTIDMGAVKFIYNGADVMSPGIVDADTDILPGGAVWVRDEKNLRPLAVGAAIMSGREMAPSKSGMAVRTLHHVGDLMWAFGHEED